VAQNSSTGIYFPQPGFVQSDALVFELNTSDVKGLTLKLHTIEFFTGFPVRDLTVDLAIPSDEIAKQLEDGAADQYVQPERLIRVAS
jgi:hypothetical protein